MSRVNVMPGIPARPIERLIGPFQRFAHAESSGGVVLMIATVVALVWANSLPARAARRSTRETPRGGRREAPSVGRSTRPA